MTAGDETPVSFEHDALPGRVIFGRGAATRVLEQEVERLGARRVLLVVTPQERALAEKLVERIDHRIVGVFDEVRPHVPAQVAAAGRLMAEHLEADALLSIGGGSTTGAAKIIALTAGIPIVAVPSTYAGSEMTPIWGMTTDGRKETGRATVVLPRVVIYDPELVDSLPVSLAVASAFNAMAHSVEALWTPQTNPVVQAMALEAARSLATGLRLTADDPRRASDSLLLGAYLAGAAFAVAGSGLHHKICHALGGAFDLPHAETHAAVMPHVLAFNEPALPDLMDRLSQSWQATSPGVGLRELYGRTGQQHTLEAAGLRRDQLAEAVDVVAQKLPIDNPRPVSRFDIESILIAAFEGAEHDDN